jgi:hypothetical protein
MPRIELGMSIEEFRAELRDAVVRWERSERAASNDPSAGEGYVPPKHCFTLPSPEGTARVALFVTFRWFAWYYVVFLDGGLEKIVPPLPVVTTMTVEPDGTRVQVEEEYTKEEMQEWVLGSPGVLIDKFPEALRQQLHQIIADEEYGKGNQNPLPAAAVLFSRVLDERAERNWQRHLELMEKYDATKIDLGMTVDEVQAILGLPNQHRDTGSGSTTNVYGERSATGDYAMPWVRVEFRDGRAVAAYTDYTSEYE